VSFHPRRAAPLLPKHARLAQGGLRASLRLRNAQRMTALMAAGNAVRPLPPKRLLRTAFPSAERLSGTRRNSPLGRERSRSGLRGESTTRRRFG
jgi:hypothetical protein